MLIDIPYSKATVVVCPKIQQKIVSWISDKVYSQIGQTIDWSALVAIKVEKLNKSSMQKFWFFFVREKFGLALFDQLG